MFCGNPIKVNNFAALFACMKFGRVTDCDGLILNRRSKRISTLLEGLCLGLLVGFTTGFCFALTFGL